LISGSVLSGRLAHGSEAYLGRYHVQVAAISQTESPKRLRWHALFDKRYSFAGTFARARGQSLPAPFTTNQNGRATALVPIDAFERLIPMNMLAEPLLRALLIKDTDRAQALGCLELDEEDLALCSFICPGKNDYGAVLRANLEQIQREG
jgi:Na+-transporting NADH:ubiquinone oxidoreductase subunit A